MNLCLKLLSFKQTKKTRFLNLNELYHFFFLLLQKLYTVDFGKHQKVTKLLQSPPKKKFVMTINQ